MAQGKHRKGRGRPSSIDLIPEDLRIQLNSALRERRVTQQQILDQFNELLVDRGKPALSRSALNRYAMQIEEKGAMLREAREAAEAIVGGLESNGQGDLTRAITEMVKSLTFDLVMRARGSNEDDGVSVETLNKVALIAQRIELASTRGIDRELKIRDQMLSEQREKLDSAVASGKLHAEAAQEARRILGFE